MIWDSATTKTIRKVAYNLFRSIYGYIQNWFVDSMFDMTSSCVHKENMWTGNGSSIRKTPAVRRLCRSYCAGKISQHGFVFTHHQVRNRVQIKNHRTHRVGLRFFPNRLSFFWAVVSVFSIWEPSLWTSFIKHLSNWFSGSQISMFRRLCACCACSTCRSESVIRNCKATYTVNNDLTLITWSRWGLGFKPAQPAQSLRGILQTGARTEPASRPRHDWLPIRRSSGQLQDLVME